MAKATPQPVLPKKYQPFLTQALSEGDLRYGAQEAGFKSLYSQATHDYGQQSQAQNAATRSLLGALAAAPADLNRVYSEAGLSPSVLAGISNSPTGQRLAGELARSQAGIQTQATGAQAGGIYQQQHLFDQYRQDVGKINDAASAEHHERGVFTDSLLQQLIGDDKAAKAAARQHTADQQFTADQNALNRESSQTNALVGAGIDPNTGAVLPGHGPKPKAKPRASLTAQSNAETNFTNAVKLGNRLITGLPLNQQTRQQAEDILLNGRPATKGQPVFETVTETVGGVKKKHQQRVLNKDGTPKMTGGTPAIPGIKDAAIVQAALDMVFNGHLSSGRVKELHDLGYRVRGLPGVKTWRDAQKDRAAAGNNPYAQGAPYSVNGPK